MRRVPVRLFVSRSTPALALALPASLVSAQGKDATAAPFPVNMAAVVTDAASGTGFDVARRTHRNLTAAAPLDGMDERPKRDAEDGS